jgi:hypothetical protein
MERKIIDPFKDGLLIEIPYHQIHKFDHLLRIRDRESVHAVIRRLQDPWDLQTYLSGSVVTNPLTGKEGYNDIDILGLGQGHSILNLIKYFSSIRGNENKLDLGGVTFNVNPVCANLERSYLMGPIDERVTLNPTGLNKLIRVKPIDISLNVQNKEGNLK